MAYMEKQEVKRVENLISELLESGMQACCFLYSHVDLTCGVKL